MYYCIYLYEHVKVFSALEETAEDCKSIIQGQKGYIVNSEGNKSGGNLFCCKARPAACVSDLPTDIGGQVELLDLI